MYVNQNIEDAAYDARFVNVKNYVLYSLGWPNVRVELAKEHVTLAIVEAVTKYYRNAALDVEMRVVPVSDASADLPDDVEPSMVKDVIFPGQIFDSYARGFGAQLEDGLGLYNMGTSHAKLMLDFDMSKYYLYLQRLEDFRTLTGTNPTWSVSHGKIKLNPIDLNVNEVGILFKYVPEDEDLDQQDWIKEYALARAKHILGTIRSKFSGFQASGANVAADGEALKAEAKEEMEKLLTRLDGMREPMPFLKG